MVYIYILKDPTTGMVRYVGKTVNLKKRLSYHSREKHNTKKNAWIKSLMKEGLFPSCEVIQRCTDNAWEAVERFWIAYYRSRVPNLTNLDSGGIQGHFKSDQTKEKQRRAQSSRKPISEETRAKMRAAKLGKKQSQEAIEAAHAPLRGRVRTKEERDRISNAVKEHWKKRKEMYPNPMSDEVREKHRKNRLGFVVSDETKQKLKEVWARRKAARAV